MTDPHSFSRRTFLKGASAAAVTGPLVGKASGGAAGRAGGQTLPPGRHDLELRVNGAVHKVSVEPRTTLLDALRDHAQLTGSKKICDRGTCGGCSVLLDGELVNACMLLAFDAGGAEVTTIEGLSAPGGLTLHNLDELHPVQKAFVECDALQCGFCTPGMVMAAVACLHKHPTPTLRQIQHEMAGNLCRCGTYGRVFEAVQRAAQYKEAGK